TPDGAPDAAPRKDVPDAPPPPPGAFTMRRRVEWRDIDMIGHVNNATYLNYMEECGIQSLGAFGWSIQRLDAEDIAIVARRYQIAYKASAVWGDELLVTTYLSDVRRISAVRHFQIARADGGDLLASAQSQWAFIHPSSGQIARVPEAILLDFADHIAS
ncbi:MAG: acyl-CoA thioesterase, partial [Anaerolineae bacterium]|nr:acyl-CoA thioesterase [Anaerolineae bacterium]